MTVGDNGAICAEKRKSEISVIIKHHVICTVFIMFSAVMCVTRRETLVS